MSTLDALFRDGWLRVVDHALALSLRRLRPETPEEVLVGAALASRALAFGHSGLSLAQAHELFAEIAPEREPPQLPARVEWRAALSASPWVASPPETNVAVSSDATPLVLELEHLYLRRYQDYEQRLATALQHRADLAPAAGEESEASWRESRLTQLFPELAHDPLDAQAHAARRLGETRLLLLTGGPGTGKTTTVARALRLRIEQARRRGDMPPRIVLAAPTGKAAARLAEAVRDSVASWRAAGAIDESTAAALPTEATTLHRLLGWRADSPAFRHDVQHPLPADLVVVDEASMVDLPLMCKLVEAVAPEATLVLIGDRDQLPSVETGDVLAALCDAADAGAAIAANRIALTRSWRQHDGIDVGELAALVREGRADAALDALTQSRLRGVHWQTGPERALAAAVLAQALPAYRAVQHAATPADALRCARAFRVLTAVREGAAGSVTLNAQIAQALQPPGARADRLFHGALVMITQNSYRHGLFNGDIGLVWREHDERGEPSLRVWFERDLADSESRSSNGLRAWFPAVLPAFDLAFALTVHKSQGSEFDHVLLALPSASAGFSRALSREGLYTGLTRCRRKLTLWVEPEALRLAIGRRAQRWSGLAQRLT